MKVKAIVVRVVDYLSFHLRRSVLPNMVHAVKMRMVVVHLVYAVEMWMVTNSASRHVNTLKLFVIGLTFVFGLSFSKTWSVPLL